MPPRAENVLLTPCPEPSRVCGAPSDPVHDFAFLRYDPAAVRFLQVEAIPLAPHEALVGTDIRVCGVSAPVGLPWQLVSRSP